MQAVTEFIGTIGDFLWGVPMIVLLLGTHLFLTFRLRFVQRHTFQAIRMSVDPENSGSGEVSQFGALATALAATIGTGNIIGVSTAIALGGPGAVFWCWLTGVLGIATKYGESLLAVKFRTKNEKGEYVGGPMYTIEKGLGKKWLAVLFALFMMIATFGTGCTVQSHAISEALNKTFGVPAALSGIVITLVSAAVILGGVKGISKVCEKLVPFMSLFYALGCVAILVLNGRFLLPALGLIVKSAFAPQAAVGGLVGGGIAAACRWGVARGLFSNESGLGTAPIVSASAKSRNPVRQAMVAMTGTFWDTVVVCAMTGLVIVSSLLRSPQAFSGVENDDMTRVAFMALPGGPYILAVALVIFAFTTILGWSYYGEKCVEYLFGVQAVLGYRILFLAVLFVGTITSLKLVWSFADLMNGLMAFPNLISVLALSGIIVKETRYYLWEGHLDETAPEKEGEQA